MGWVGMVVLGWGMWFWDGAGCVGMGQVVLGWMGQVVLGWGRWWWWGGGGGGGMGEGVVGGGGRWWEGEVGRGDGWAGVAKIELVFRVLRGHEK